MLTKRNLVRLFSFIVAGIIILTVLPSTRADALDLGASYEVLLRDYPECIERLKDGGATEAGIQSFLADLEAEVNKRGSLNQANFNSYMYESLKEVVTWRKHRAIFNALLDSYGQEIDYTLSQGQLHPDLVPIRNAVMEAIFSSEDEEEEQNQQEEENNQPREDENLNKEETGGEGKSTSKGQEPSLTTGDITQLIQEQLKAGQQTITLTGKANGSVVTIKGDILQQVWDNSRSLLIDFEGVLIKLDPDSITLAEDNSLSLSVTQVGDTIKKQILNQTPAAHTLVGDIYELAGTTQSSIGGIYFEQPVTITMSYTQEQLKDLDEDTLDIYYFNEGQKTWEKTNAELNQANKTLTFTTRHFSKYAIISYNPAAEVPVVESKFVDLKGHWAEGDIAKMVELGLVKGISDTQFAPDVNITRAEFAALLLRDIGAEQKLHLTGRFYDVPADKWYFNVVNTAAELGLVTGYTDKNFGPDDPVTREQMAVMIKRALVYQGEAEELNTLYAELVLSKFKDRDKIAEWAKDSVAIAVEKGIVKGRTDNEFAPTATATRAEAAVMILRTYNLLH
ncbi:MAG: S-layer homology domain-containing protein [Syntrophomonadaceae bacterium]